MHRKIPKSVKLYDSVYGNDFPVYQYYVILFDKISSTFYFKNFFKYDIIKYFQDIGFCIEYRIENKKKYYSKEVIIMISHTKRIIIQIDCSVEEDDGVTINVLYDIEQGRLKSQIDFDEIEKYEIIKKKGNIKLIKSDMGGLDTEDFTIKVPDVDLELNYGYSFIKSHDIIFNRLNTNNDKGIVLLHGEPGSGKTTYVKYLTKLITDKDILFIPPSMAEVLSEPSIISFLIERKNSVLIIEDAEKIIADRDGNPMSAGVSNLLNITDGILGDCLNIQVIATFNMRKERIDRALLRKGRLIAEHKFDKLSVNDSNKLLEHIGKDFRTDTPMLLSDIYNIDVDDVRITKDIKKIGF